MSRKSFRTLKGLRLFVDSIPKSKFIKHFLVDNRDRPRTHCIMGHLNNAFSGHWGTFDATDKVLKKIKVKGISLVLANNNAIDNPKQGVLDYVDSLIVKRQKRKKKE